MKKRPQFKNLLHSLKEKYSPLPDPWGLVPERTVSDLKLIWPFYRYYFDVHIHFENRDEIDDLKNYIAISNHTGQIPLDGLLICSAFALELNKPVVLRPMVERFLTGLPFLGLWSQEGGAVLGDRQNCIELLKRGESVLVFPEGVKGIAKNTSQFYQLQKFTRGFIRMALASHTPIVPIAVVGAEEFYPFVFHSKMLAKIFDVPALPLSPNLVPLPSPIDIYVGDAYYLPAHLTIDSSDQELDLVANELEERVKKLTEHGLKNKRTLTKRGKNFFKTLTNKIIKVES